MRLIPVILAVSTLLSAQSIPEDRGAAGLRQSLRRLANPIRVLSITAHPDDEDAATLTRLARGEGVRVSMLILNRGESGANVVSGDFFDALGLLRTLEMERAAAQYGVERVRYTRFIDYGYSKNVAETFRNWNRDSVLEEVVRAIREQRPHVILSRWQGTPRDGHGNHEAAGILAQEAFDAAADASRFTAAGPVWSAAKLYLDNRREVDEWTMKYDTDGYDPLLGRSYVEIARDGYRAHRSQGAGGPMARRGPAASYYLLAKSRVGPAVKETSFFDRLDAGSAPAPLRAALAAFSFEHPEAAAPHLAEAWQTAAPRDRPLIARAIEQSLGIAIEARVESRTPASGPFRTTETFSHATPGQTFRVSMHVTGGDVQRVDLVTPWKVRPLGDSRFEVTVPPDAPDSRAPWSRGSVRDTAYAARPGAPPLTARVVFRIAGRDVTIERPVGTRFLDATGLEHARTLPVAPPVSVAFDSDAGVLPLGSREYKVAVRVRSFVDGEAAGSVRLDLPAGWRADPATHSFRFVKELEEVPLTFRVTAPAGAAAGDYPVAAVASHAGREWRDSFRMITQPGLDAAYLAAPARHVARMIDVKVAPGIRAGYIMGTGDTVPATLAQLGVPVDLLDRDALASADLGKYTVILAGIRAYAVRDDLRTYNQRLLDYVAAGGVLIVQYNTPEFDRNYGPFPYTMGRNPEEVSKEDSPVTILAPGNPVFTMPNRITPADFSGWVEQRGSKFLATWDPRYEALIETHDTGQAPQRGAWVAAKHGKGVWVYCAMAWYRQLPYAVPGAVRLFANLISLGASSN